MSTFSTGMQRIFMARIVSRMALVVSVLASGSYLHGQSNEGSERGSPFFQQADPPQALRPMPNNMVEAMVNELQGIRDKKGSVVSDAFHSIAPSESPDAVFREELMQLASRPWQEQKGNPPEPRAGNRPLPFHVNQPVRQAVFDQPEPATPQPLKPMPMKMPATAHFSDQYDGHTENPSTPHVSRNTESVRRIARTLDEAAADLEDFGRYDEADRIRNIAHGLRLSGRVSDR